MAGCRYCCLADDWEELGERGRGEARKYPVVYLPVGAALSLAHSHGQDA